MTVPSQSAQVTLVDPSAQFKFLGHCLAGVFQNRQQALANPTWFVHLKLWIHPINLFTEDSIAFFLEQASAAYPQPPYRQRVLRIRPDVDGLVAEYYALQQPQSYQGAAQNPARLALLKENELQTLANSRLSISSRDEPTGRLFEGRQAPGEQCQFFVDGAVKYVQLAFDVLERNGNTTFKMYDKGIDPNTGNATWGALQGPFILQKIEDFSSALPGKKS